MRVGRQPGGAELLAAHPAEQGACLHRPPPCTCSVALALAAHVPLPFLHTAVQCCAQWQACCTWATWTLS